MMADAEARALAAEVASRGYRERAEKAEAERDAAVQRAAQAEAARDAIRAERCEHRKCPGGSLCCCLPEDRLRAERDALAAQIGRNGGVFHGGDGPAREYVHVPGCEGEAACPACWLNRTR